MLEGIPMISSNDKDRHRAGLARQASALALIAGADALLHAAVARVAALFALISDDTPHQDQIREPLALARRGWLTPGPQLDRIGVSAPTTSCTITTHATHLVIARDEIVRSLRSQRRSGRRRHHRGQDVM